MTRGKCVQEQYCQQKKIWFVKLISVQLKKVNNSQLRTSILTLYLPFKGLLVYNQRIIL